MKKPMSKCTRAKHEARNAEYERLHRICREAAEEEREAERRREEAAAAYLRPARLAVGERSGE